MIRNNPKPEDMPEATGAMTVAGGVVLGQVRQTVAAIVQEHINQLMEANKAIRTQLKK